MMGRVVTARYKGGPRDEIPLKHFVEQLARVINSAAFCVHIEDVVGDNGVEEQANFDGSSVE
ncbi:hypothetical protein SAY87_025604 [Trapa incisa]|uniref:Uncharacterized protein n=1 Tax=Trapa incisa TaxID=236973 RepID=A0AAN7GU20_9MYRT|nr:hypothetical protein SAY87_025604 [Trapa incisa]